MSAEEVEKLERERRDADRRYNDALTALDRAIVSLQDHEATRDDAGRIGTALLGFLQQITGFVETKDRQLAAEARARADALSQTLGSLDELRAQTTALRRAVEAVVRGQSSVGSQSPVVSQQSVGSQVSVISQQTVASQSSVSGPQSDDWKYVAFEDQFRGSDRAIEDRLRAYVPLFAGRSDVVDLGCGRGELLAAMRDAGIASRGVDANASMVAAARERGLDAAHGDALGYLSAQAPASLGGVVATQVVEHLEPAYLVRLLDAAAHALRPGAPIVVETINPACWLAFFSSYIRDLTHVRPVHPDTLQYLLRASGFERVEIRFSAPVPDHMKMKAIDLPAATLASSDPIAAAVTHVADTANANAVLLNNLMFTHLDYAAIGYRI